MLGPLNHVGIAVPSIETFENIRKNKYSFSKQTREGYSTSK